MAWRKPTNLRGWLDIVLRHKKKFFFPAVVVAIAVMVGSHYVPREYRAQGRFERVTDSVTTLGTERGSIQARQLEPIRRALSEDMRGRASIEQVIDDLGLTQGFPRMPDGELTAEGRQKKELLIRQIQGRVGLRFSIRSDVIDLITISYTADNPELGPKIVNQLIENYIRKTRQQLDDGLTQAKAFFQKEVNRQRVRISDLETDKLRFEMQYPSLSPDGPGGVRNQLAALEAQMHEIDVNLSVARDQHDYLQNWIAHQPEMIQKTSLVPNPERLALIERRSVLERQLDAHLHQWLRTDEHPEVVQTRRQIEQLTGQINEAEQEVPGPTELVINVSRIEAEQRVQELSGTIVALERQAERSQGRLERLEILDRNFMAVRNQYLTMQRELAEARSQLSFWDGHMKRTDIALTAEIGNRGVRLNVIDRADVDQQPRPSKPTAMGIVAMALMAGMGVGAGLILLAELLDQSFRNVEQAVDELKLPVLGAVNEITTPQQAFRRKIVTWGVYPPLAVLMVLVLVVSYALAWMSLEKPQEFDQFKNNPGQYFTETFAGES